MPLLTLRSGLAVALLSGSIAVASSPGWAADASAPSHWVAVSSGYAHSCALKDDGSLWCWGSNSGGELGIGSTTDQSTPAQVGDQSWVSAGAGGSVSCAVRVDHTLWCWGTGALGLGSPRSVSEVPVQVGHSASWATVSVSESYACAIQLDGSLWCWGNDHYGQLGSGERQSTWHPHQVGTDADWASVRTSIFGSTCAIKTNGQGWCWGFYFDKHGDFHRQLAPRQIGAASWTSMSVFYGVQADGTLWRWNLGYRPQQVGDDTWASVLERNGTVCGIQTAGTLWCFGEGADGNLGHGTHDRDHFIQITDATDWSAVDGGQLFGVGLRSDGTMWAWGLNDHGQLGDGTTTERHHPVQIRG